MLLNLVGSPLNVNEDFRKMRSAKWNTSAEPCTVSMYLHLLCIASLHTLVLTCSVPCPTDRQTNEADTRAWEVCSSMPNGDHVLWRKRLGAWPSQITIPMTYATVPAGARLISYSCMHIASTVLDIAHFLTDPAQQSR
jgi:hypothetical protein